MDNTDISNITSRATSAFCGLEDSFKTFYSKMDFERALQKVKSAKGSSKNSRHLPNLYRMLDDCGIEYEKDMEDSYYEEIINERMQIGEYNVEALEDRMLLALYERFEGYSTPIEYIKRLLDRLQDPNDVKKWLKCSVRVRILKQFIKYGGYLEEAGFGSRPNIEKYAERKLKTEKKKLDIEEIADLVEEDIFDEYDTPIDDEKKERENRKPKGKYGLLKLCDDLAYGKYRTQGGTKKGLYYLAMVLNMKLPGFKGANDNNDVVKNLFRDYYTNNLMRYMTEAYRKDNRGYENPSGLGINFKNFAEMVFLYFLAKDDLDSSEKIRLSNKMITELIKEASNKGSNDKKKTNPDYGLNNTQMYRGLFVYNSLDTGKEVFGTDILCQDEESFMDFILENYNCSTNNAAGVLQVESDQNSAFKNYKMILDKLKNELENKSKWICIDEKDREKKGMLFDQCNYGLWFVDVSAYQKEGLNSLIDKYEGVDKEKFENLMEVLSGANHFVGNNITENVSKRNGDKEHSIPSKTKIKALSVNSPKNITRTDILVAFYYYFNTLYEDDNDMEWRGYGELFEAFKDQIDPVLDECGYQEVSGKCLFDVVLTFSSYARMMV